jgi:hypothetical protein
MATGKWEVVPFTQATELILNGVADGMHQISRKEKLAPQNDAIFRF